MKYVRFLIPLVLLSIAVPAFAVCGYCDNNNCVWQPGLGSRCYYKNFLCYSECREEFAPGCSAFTEIESFDTEYRIVSVQVEEPQASAIKQDTPAITSKKLKKTT